MLFEGEEIMFDLDDISRIVKALESIAESLKSIESTSENSVAWLAEIDTTLCDIGKTAEDIRGKRK
jgi:hypothetical protein